MLKNPKGELHPLVRQGNLSLIACLITGDPSQAEDFRAGLPLLCSMPEGKVLQILTHRPGENGFIGVVREAMIPITRL